MAGRDGAWGTAGFGAPGSWIWCALSNAGRTCAGVERVYAVREIHGELCRRVVERATAMTEETFGPVVVVNPVADADEAVERGNASRYALGAAVFSGSARSGAAVVSRLRAGAVSVNSGLGFVAVPALPFGGTQESGFGRIHGEEGLRAFTSVQSMTVQRFSPPIALTSFEVPAAVRERAVRTARSLHRRRRAGAGGRDGGVRR